jgi:carboxypeptidase C (cathepsin A)
MWFNGGPGCSSLLGVFQELGPYVIDSDNNPSQFRNPWSWNKNASLLAFESPAGVGWSVAGTDEDWKTNDMRSSEDAMSALLAWFTKFPEYKTGNNPFFVSGESYGGIYVPFMTW